MAKSRHIGRPTFVARFFASHSSAQARMRSRDARGSDGGGADVSTAGVGARCCGAATDGRAAFGEVLGAADSLASSGFFAVGVCGGRRRGGAGFGVSLMRGALVFCGTVFFGA